MIILDIMFGIMFFVMFILIVIVGVKVIWWYFIKGNLWKNDLYEERNKWK
jgi:hypothetical protein